MIELLDNGGNWYKGNLHMHTTLSDGKLSPREAIKLYKQAGYDFIALTDHWLQGESGDEDGLLILSGGEWDTGDMISYPVFHIVGAGMKEEVKLKRSVSGKPQDIIDAIIRAGGAAILAHPAWSVTNPSDCLKLKGLCGAEIYNTVSGLPWNCRPDSSLYFDIWASQGKLLRCMAADDSHFYAGEQTYSFIMVNAPELTADAILKALSRGSFFASQGPVFRSITLDGEMLTVECSEAESVIFYSNTVWCKDRVTRGPVTAALYELKPTDRYVRIELIDSKGKRAWSSPFFVNGFEGI
jgi:hypothetical protein